VEEVVELGQVEHRAQVDQAAAALEEAIPLLLEAMELSTQAVGAVVLGGQMGLKQGMAVPAAQVLSSSECQTTSPLRSLRV
jgi:glutamate/tyrosine decarboxylase-like PLP-dependent enzyme